jgi:carbon monoxide dehydrogenase subunit G
MAAIHVWRRVLDAFFGPLERSVEARRVRRSYSTPFVTGSGRDSMRFYSGGRSVDVSAELLMGDVQRRIHASYLLVWRETGEKLTEAQATHVIDSVCQHFDQRKVKWEIFPAETISTRKT